MHWQNKTQDNYSVSSTHIQPIGSSGCSHVIGRWYTGPFWKWLTWCHENKMKIFFFITFTSEFLILHLQLSINVDAEAFKKYNLGHWSFSSMILVIVLAFCIPQEKCNIFGSTIYNIIYFSLSSSKTFSLITVILYSLSQKSSSHSLALSIQLTYYS